MTDADLDIEFAPWDGVRVPVTLIGGYLGAIFGTPDAAAPLWWLGAYAVFVGLNMAGVEVSFRFTVAITGLALAILVVFWIGALPHFDLALALDPWFVPVDSAIVGIVDQVNLEA